MARRLRIEYPGAMHHVINRGYRGGWADDIEGIRCDGEFLKELATEELRWERKGLTGLGRG